MAGRRRDDFPRVVAENMKKKTHREKDAPDLLFLWQQ